MEDYFVPAQAAVTEFLEKRSRFIGQLWQVQTAEQALSHLQQTRALHYDAKHNVYAYLLRSGEQRCSDDGEPQGTAGMPVLEVLRREGLCDVCCVVTRYFGGILLGAGNLTRAYARSAKEAVQAAGIARMQSWTRLELACPYALYERLRREVAALEGLLQDPTFGAAVQVQVLFPREKTEEFLHRLTELSAGTVCATVLGEEYRALAQKKPEK